MRRYFLAKFCEDDGREKIFPQLQKNLCRRMTVGKCRKDKKAPWLGVSSSSQVDSGKRQTEFFLQRCWWAGACVAAVFICSPF